MSSFFKSFSFKSSSDPKRDSANVPMPADRPDENMPTDGPDEKMPKRLEKALEADDKQKAEEEAKPNLSPRSQKRTKSVRVLGCSTR